ncbi:hypothetical protein K9O30_07455 [Clostridium bowmanii]|uniref:hypothetical protein n=1 Tax=Clostridium bowmanii TaxID=132925 RepID=UPI001C0AB091|nr:hypothetical protein [Clostridium bowmanii]MBU3189589.1 hypothetical protein [Clostridium bowmanii]MCA1073568.1 hypothetical protein [Clostridium bowmanii]
MIKNSITNIYILIVLLVFSISMLIDTNANTVELGLFLLIFAFGTLIAIISEMIKYHISKNYYRKPNNVNEQKKIEAILSRKYINQDGTYSFDELKKLRK